MPTPDPQLPPPEEIGAWIRDQRSQYDISQQELAKRAGISPSQLSRIENRTGRATYQTLYDLQQLFADISDTDQSRIADLVRHKHDTVSEELTLVWAAPDQRIESLIDQLQQLDISQLPVLDMGENVGRLTTQQLVASGVDPDDLVEDHMGRPFPELPADAPVSTAREHLQTNRAILITPGGTDLQAIESTGFAGVLTPVDLANY